MERFAATRVSTPRCCDTAAIVTQVDFFDLDPRTIRDLRHDALDRDGRLRILPAAWWAATTPQERGLFGTLTGLYSFPTVELVDHLRNLIGGRAAIEIGAGHGVLAEALGIPATDSRMQEREPYRSIYARVRQPIVPYGPNIVECDAAAAVRRYRPEVVIGCWATHKYDPARHEDGGIDVGFDMLDILAHCAVYVAVGNERVHRKNPLWSRPHDVTYPPFVYSRAQNGSRDFIAVWAGQRASPQHSPVV